MTEHQTGDASLLDSAEYRETLGELLLSLLGDTGMRLSVCDLDGSSIGGFQRPGTFCDCVSAHPLEQNCRRCLLWNIRHAADTGAPSSCRCHMGLVSTVLPIPQDGRIVGCVLLSGYRMEQSAMQALPAPLPDHVPDSDAPELQAKFNAAPFFPQERIQDFIRMLTVTIAHLTRLNEHTQALIDLQGKSLELLANANIREQQEKKKTKNAYKVLESRVQDQFLFDAMGHLSALAALEHNDEMAQLLQDLAVVGQKVRHPHDMVVLSQEIDDLERYFHLLRSMYAGRVRFQLDLDDSCDPDLILMQLPFGTLIDILLREMLMQESPKEVCTVTVSLSQNEGAITLKASIDTGVMPAILVQQFRHLRFPSGDVNGLVFKELIEEQRQYYGPGVRWDCTCESGKATTLSLLLPLKEGGTL